MAGWWKRLNLQLIHGLSLVSSTPNLNRGRQIRNRCLKDLSAPSCKVKNNRKPDKMPLIDLLPEQKTIADLGGTLRLGAYPCRLQEGTKTKVAYDGAHIVEERHRHRYDF